MNISLKDESTAVAGENLRSSDRGIPLRKNFIFTLSGNFVYGASQWGILVALAKMGSPEMVGRFALALAITAPVILFANLNLRAVLYTDANNKFAFGDCLSLRLFMNACAICVIAGITLTFSYDRELIWVIFSVALAKVFESTSDLFFGLMQQNERMDMIAISLTIKGVLSVLMFIAGLYFGGNLFWGTLCMMFAWFITLCIWEIPRSRAVVNQIVIHSPDLHEKFALRPTWSVSRSKTLAMLALPLGFATLFNSLLTNIPRYFIGGMLGERELGIFAALSYVMIIGARVITALGETAGPRLARYYYLKDIQSYKRLIVKMIGVGSFIGIVGVLVASFAGSELLTLLYKPEYAENTDVFVLLMVAAGIGYNALFLQYGMTAALQFVWQPVLILLAAFILTVSCIVLIPSFGFAGAAIAVTIGSAVQLAGNLYVNWRIINSLEIASPD